MDAEIGPCLACGGELQPIGTLGSLAWFRCRACGIDVSAPAVPADADEVS